MKNKINAMECPDCGDIIKRSYPGGDPENGPSGFYCPRIDCQVAQDKREFDLWWWGGLTAEEREDYLEEQRRLDAMFDEAEKKYNLVWFGES